MNKSNKQSFLEICLFLVQRGQNHTAEFVNKFDKLFNNEPNQVKTLEKIYKKSFGNSGWEELLVKRRKIYSNTTWL